ncbi:hypothetical protein A3I99_02580 [Candidatus Kaiserbacteria bacterium RIFCSPLOWO2_02_FULL_45_11b]|uniref:Uncharacterized protein n=1 Tax=Candidatus Kaiserbacteria bacterium RIFCSPLOWO2_12_FULL_45_26 TaxID=1798525 RepID=A0A1F6FF99_9BACT|nr:MAG: hypothetical protein A2Z56_01770 [Candidatus Kaiserbacteria bacterium RIFCSPHIGHO2_12_45_16]OGG70273.1 MAG: hypothetical protein A2929_04325 [Candidatus Kaiserbacteria bacterium RIFCSPLOWO2_01_FULL_45_25]OGG81941.1 MAG: hypothetical protein A3I99_02580 [Candidatus Kaiserbacteria bacterium RIFCSPLOWO2_02_FULL_45_11b]OGG84537.1 MAG: hypothetical protein A3G90_00370 [Candidatus Kaiserbacteria bacterium RIFCSPLOWO2_12_FULL_45_26]
MGTRHEVLGRVVVIKKGDRNKHGNGAKGSGRQNGTGLTAYLYQIDKDGNRTLIASAPGSSFKDVKQKLRAAAPGKIPTYVAIKDDEETHF